MMKIQYVFLVSIVSVVVAGCVTETTRSRPMASTTDQTKKRVYTQEEIAEDRPIGDGTSLGEIRRRCSDESSRVAKKIVFDDGKSTVWTNFDLTTIDDITISFKDGKPWATWK